MKKKKKMMMLLLRFFRSYYLGEIKGVDKGCGITVALFVFFPLLFLEGGEIVRIVWY